MRISSTSIPGSSMPANKLINKVAKYLKRSIDSAYKLSFSSNNADVFIIVYFQKPILPDKPGGDKSYGNIEEMKIHINLTTYQNKIRVNLYEISPDEQTLGHYVFLPETLTDLEYARQEILDKIKKRINKLYEDYEFIF